MVHLVLCQMLDMNIESMTLDPLQYIVQTPSDLHCTVCDLNNVWWKGWMVWDILSHHHQWSNRHLSWYSLESFWIVIPFLRYVFYSLLNIHQGNFSSFYLPLSLHALSLQLVSQLIPSWHGSIFSTAASESMLWIWDLSYLSHHHYICHGMTLMGKEEMDIGQRFLHPHRCCHQFHHLELLPRNGWQMDWNWMDWNLN